MKETASKVKRLEKHLACCRMRNFQLITNLDSAAAKTRALCMVNAHLEQHLVATRLAQKHDPVMQAVQRESDHRRAVEAALHASISELEMFRRANFGVHACSPIGGMVRDCPGFKDNAFHGTCSSKYPQEVHKRQPKSNYCACGEKHPLLSNSLGRLTKDQSCSHVGCFKGHCHEAQTRKTVSTVRWRKSDGHSTRHPEASNALHQQRAHDMTTVQKHCSDLLHQDAMPIEDNSLLQHAAMAHKRLSADLQVHNRLLFQEVSKTP